MPGREMRLVAPLVDRYLSAWLGADVSALRPGRPVVIESERRLRPEKSYGFIHALWCLAFDDGRMAASVPPGAGGAVASLLDGREPRRVLDTSLAGELRGAVDAALVAAGRGPVHRVFTDLRYACTPATLRRHVDGDVRRLVDESIPPADGLRLPTQCFPDGIAYGVVADGRVVAVAHAHRNGNLEGIVADVGVETAPAYRRRGYARTCVSAVVAHIVDRGGEAAYHCSPENLRSQATALSVGFVPYGRSLVLAAPYSHSE